MPRGVQKKIICRGCEVVLKDLGRGNVRRADGEGRAKWHHYGGYVCSRPCEVEVYDRMAAQNIYSSDDARAKTAALSAESIYYDD